MDSTIPQPLSIWYPGKRQVLPEIVELLKRAIEDTKLVA
jgi:hypothetical protein